MFGVERDENHSLQAAVCHLPMCVCVYIRAHMLKMRMRRKRVEVTGGAALECCVKPRRSGLTG